MVKRAPGSKVCGLLARLAIIGAVIWTIPFIGGCRGEKVEEGPEPGSTAIGGKPLPPQAKNATTLPDEAGVMPVPGGGGGKKGRPQAPKTQ